VSLTAGYLKPLIERNGPVDVITQAGDGITHAPSGMFQAIDPPLGEVWSVRDVKLVLFDEQTRPAREIPGQHIVDVKLSQPGVIVVVDDSVEADPGQTLRTRGA
jgi:hypothetical protein